MGLDMYLERMPKINNYNMKQLIRINDLILEDFEVFKGTNQFEEFKFYIKKSEKYEWFEMKTEMGYWRKANQIHRWFVENVQNGIDDCDYYEVSKEQLIKLKNVCERILDYEGDIFENIAKEFLPTQRGCFFGSIEYDNYYLKDLEETIKIIEKVLKEVDFEKEYVIYSSSW